MGIKGSNLSSTASEAVEKYIAKIESIAGITSKKMFGGYGVFHEGKMFSLVNSEGGIYLKSDESSRHKFEKYDAPQHARMTYFQIPGKVYDVEQELISWVHEAIEISKKV